MTLKEQNKGIGLWAVHFPDTDGAWYMEQYEFIGLRTCHFHPVGQYVCQSYFDSLSHYQSLRFVPAAYGEHNDWGTAVTVVLALMVLAVIGGMYKGEDVGGLFWAILLGKVLALFGLIIFLMPRISRWFFRTYEDAVMQFVFVLAMVFLGVD